ncbi:uncharacterized protein K460DRAFT_406353 [Cucurbitaria berberidis CBS 394.84]|uniref:Uncharacterized protein n=1 Tax=Cucurbitaria berberidis CBS 394.84 TaxID=1168544 RepID=A0A9P4GJ59_9PLEO|nr:uncharacterized protein K460DRAFT_406353 [Cucurbitaria berberidis CBS 394.84]KAF1846131.1 hypothetical protein K460DRAFT_406353 [Cucurbitaria berberidis CBS 394.84]
MIERVDQKWAQSELIPFLNTVFYEQSHSAWQEAIRVAEMNIDNIPFYEDFPSTMDCLRLALINPAVLTAAETTKFDPVKNMVQLCVSIFVRHAIRHETWPLFSMGLAPSRDFPRPLGSSKPVGNAKQGNSDGLLQVSNVIQRQSPVQEVKAWKKGSSAPKQQVKDNGESKPRGHRSGGLGELSLGRRPNPVTSRLAYETWQGHATRVDHAYGMPSSYDARYGPTSNFHGTPSPMAPQWMGVSRHDQTFFPGQEFGTSAMQQAYRHGDVDPMTGLCSALSYTSLQAGSDLSGAYYDPSYQYGSSQPAISRDNFQHSVAPLQGGDALASESGTGSHRLRAEAKDFNPGAAPHGLESGEGINVRSPVGFAS